MSIEGILIVLVLIGAVAFFIGERLALEENKPEAGLPYLLMTFSTIVTAVVVTFGKIIVVTIVGFWRLIMWAIDD